MIKSFITDNHSNLRSLTEYMTKLMNKLVDNECIIINSNINTNGKLWVGVIFYKSSKLNNFTLR